jgi:hypothetical protein
MKSARFLSFSLIYLYVKISDASSSVIRFKHFPETTETIWRSNISETFSLVMLFWTSLSLMKSSICLLGWNTVCFIWISTGIVPRQTKHGYLLNVRLDWVETVSSSETWLVSANWIDRSFMRRTAASVILKVVFVISLCRNWVWSRLLSDVRKTSDCSRVLSTWRFLDVSSPRILSSYVCIIKGSGSLK